jgi:hypothetical protein
MLVVQPDTVTSSATSDWPAQQGLVTIQAHPSSITCDTAMTAHCMLQRVAASIVASSCNNWDGLTGC